MKDNEDKQLLWDENVHRKMIEGEASKGGEARKINRNERRKNQGQSIRL